MVNGSKITGTNTNLSVSKKYVHNISAVSSHTINTNLSKISIITSNDPDYGTPDFVWINGLGFVANNVNSWSISNVSGGSFKISTSYGGYAINIVAIGE